MQDEQVKKNTVHLAIISTNLQFANKFDYYPANIFVQKMPSALYICCIYSNVLKIYFITDANTMNPDQTAPKGSNLIWVHIVCNIGHKNTKPEERADDDHHEYWQKG